MTGVVRIKTPPEVVSRPEVQRALRAGDWSVVLQAVIRETGASQTEIAMSVGVSQPHISRLINGRIREPGIHTVRALCDGLAIPRALAGLLDEDQEVVTNRRQILAGAAGISGLALISTIDGGVPIDSPDEEYLLTIPSVTYRRLEQRVPSRSLIAPVSAHLALIRQLALRDGRSPAHTRRLFALLSETAGLAAWLFVDVEDPGNARRHYLLAVKAAERSGHPLLPAYMYGSYGQFVAGCGDARQSIRLVADARRRLPRSAPAIAAVWLDSIESLALAEARDRNALAKLSQAETRLAKAAGDEPIWPWIFRFDARKLSGFRAQAAMKLGRFRLAEKAVQIAYDPEQAPKPRALVEILWAEALARTGHPDEAGRLATEAFKAGKAYDSERVLRSVVAFRKTLGEKGGRVTADLDERLHATYREEV